MWWISIYRTLGAAYALFVKYVGCTEWSLQTNNDIAHSCLYITHTIGSKDTAIPMQAYYRPIGLQEAEMNRFRKKNRHFNVVRLSALWTDRLCPQEISLVLIFGRGRGFRRAIVRPEGLCQWKITITPPGNRTRDLPACSAVPQTTASPPPTVCPSLIAVKVNILKCEGACRFCKFHEIYRPI
jgi:hypothetical protein